MELIERIDFSLKQLDNYKLSTLPAQTRHRLELLQDCKVTIEQLQAEVEELKNPIYCKKCGACGESGCCPPDRCNCLYGDEYKTEYTELCAENEHLQAKIDALMLEYCPDEMTEEQMDNWGKHQVLAKNTGSIQ